VRQILLRAQVSLGHLHGRMPEQPEQPEQARGKRDLDKRTDISPFENIVTLQSGGIDSITCLI
jgi:hypothetical protein